MTVEGEYVLAGTGSRSLRMADAQVRAKASALVENRLRQRQAERGDELIVMSGMAEGFDHLLACTALRLGIPLWAAIPSRYYGDYYWRLKSVTGADQFAEFCRVRDAAGRVTYVMEDIHHTDRLYLGDLHANLVRNLWMVEQAHEFLVWDPSSSGTRHCVADIKEARVPYEVLS